MTLAVILGILFLIISYVYFTRQAGDLPHFFPGYQAGLDKVHDKHAIAALLLGIGCFVLAWFQSGPKKSTPTTTATGE